MSVINEFKYFNRFDIDERKFFWLIGILEADGGFVKPRPKRPNSPRISVSMQDEDTIRKVAFLLGASYHKYQPKGGRKKMYCTDISGRRAYEVCMQIYFYMSNRRKQQIKDITKSYKPRQYRRGEDHHHSTLTEEDVLEIAGLIQRGADNQTIADEFDVTDGCISSIRHGRSWSWLTKDVISS